MKTAGIICEYNPFHNGHKKQLDYAREVLGCDAVILAMSGDFVQRGEPAILDKYSRAVAALRNGADLVLELPVSSVLSSAEGFATAGVRLLDAAGADVLLFGASYPDPALYQKVADILEKEPPSYQASLQKHLKEGFSYPHARALSLQEEFAGKIDHLKDFLLSPNDVLGIEYRKALDKIHSSMEFCPMKRIGADYLDQEILGDTASASYIRKMISKSFYERDPFSITSFQNKLSKVLPEDSLRSLLDGQRMKTLLFADDLSSLLNYRLLMADPLKEGIEKAGDFQNRLQKEILQYGTFNERADSLKSKNITRSHICRLFCRMILDLGPEDHDASIAYFHVLGFTDKGRELLSNLHSHSKGIPIIVNPGSDQKKLTESQRKVLKEDLRAGEICRMIREEKSGLHFPSEMRRKFLPIPKP